MRLSGVLVLALGALTSLTAFLSLKAYYFEPNTCTMSYSSPSYAPVPFKSSHSKVSSKYKLFLYREQGSSPPYRGIEDASNLGGTPVLFIPGNAGSYSQGRTFSSASADALPNLDWFLVDFDSDFSAMHGKTLIDEARYVNDAIAEILELYKHNQNEEVHPSSVIIVAHSMGGIVARTLVTLENYIEDSVNTIITLSTPHAYPPITFDRDITQLYDVVNQWWLNKPAQPEITLVSLAGGHNDLLVLPDMTVTDFIGGMTVFSYEIPGVGLGIDHLAMAWCLELRDALVQAIAGIIDPSTAARTIPYGAKMHALSRRLRHPDTSSHSKSEAVASSSMFWGRPSHHEITGPSDITLPSRSSIVSYKLDSTIPVRVVHHTEKERRDHGVVQQATLMWYSAGPYVPFSENTERLTIHVELPNENGITSGGGGPARITIGVNWLATLANIAIHYRTLAACWPFAVVLITLMAQVRSQGTISFEKAFFNQLLNRWSLPLAVVLSIVHCALTNPGVRSALRLAQIPSEARNVASLRHQGYDAHDLLLGLNDPELLWIAPLLLSIAIGAVCIVFLASSIIIEIASRTSSLFTGRGNVTKKEADGNKNQKTSEKRSQFIEILGVALMLVTLYLIPYQVSTVLLAVIQLLRIRDRRGIKFGVSQLLLWTSVVDAPIVAVWAGNLTFEWLWAFASLRNIVSALPVAIFVLYVKPDANMPSTRSLVVRVLILSIMGYIVAYAFTYGGLHAFMLHHLTSYLVTVFLLATIA